MDNNSYRYVTATGRELHINNINIEDICLEDIAHHLSSYSNCRFGGALPLGIHYSVAQHCCLLAYYALNKLNYPELARNLLMHDASEAYLGDIVRGLKLLLPDYLEIESKVSKLIQIKYNLSHSSGIRNKMEKELDSRILLDECMNLIPRHIAIFRKDLEDLEPLGIQFSPWPPQLAYKNFLELCNKLDIKD